ncbi:zinc ribbon domain-containing protein [uncultured Alistipes sp.]|jgi:hypothetical protein|uniref:zinc ribbon domain-containing protein n=1 Tax=uncultured Alistipes sp. TaxID=538949 RepID=UPI0025FCF4FB|nr:zinc ribbon domain-containing protein [uncultured Alistipes sp.]
MKTCPVCGVQMEDHLRFCEACGAEYVVAVVSEITSGVSSRSGADAKAAAPDPSLALNGLEEEVAKLNDVPLPKIGDTVRKMMPGLSGVAVVFFFVAGWLTGANIFYILAVVAFVVLGGSGAASMKGKKRFSPGEVLVRAAISILANDASALMEEFPHNADVPKRLDTMKKKADEALALQKEAQRRNRRKILLVALVVFLICSAGVGALAVRKHAADKAAAEYAAQPEWVKLRDSYMASDATDEAGRKELRQRVVSAMIGDGQGAAAEEFFFAHSQGQMGDVDCATLIANYYKDSKNTESLNAFVDKVKLRYDSDTRKVRNLKK